MTKYDTLSNTDLDRLVAERVLMWGHIDQSTSQYAVYNMTAWVEPGGRCHESGPPSFTTSMDDCLEHVIPAMRERGLYLQLFANGTGFWCWFADALKNYNYTEKYEHKSLPRACCISALLAIETLKEVREDE